MLPKRHRLTRSGDFVRVRRFGRSCGSSLLALYVLPTRPPDLQVGFSVSKRVGKATIRNRVKRLMREAVRRELPTVCPGQRLLFVARTGSAGASYHQLVETIAHLLRKCGTLCRDG